MTKPDATFAEIEAWLIEDAGDIAAAKARLRELEA